MALERCGVTHALGLDLWRLVFRHRLPPGVRIDMLISPNKTPSVGYALTIGLNSVDPKHYDGWVGQLFACEADAKSMHALLYKRGFQVKCLLTKSATRQAVLDQIAQAATAAKPGDIFVLTNSSHGGQLPDLNGDESDGMDETLCMYDGQIVDDELFFALGAFVAGVRIFMISDSCHSGTVARMVEPRHEYARDCNQSVRSLPPDVVLNTYHANHAMYDAILEKPELKDARANVKASVLLISGCMDNQTASDGTFNGLFTSKLLRVWNAGTFKGSYRTFRNQIVRQMPSDQTPNLFWAANSDAIFEAETPFTIARKA